MQVQRTCHHLHSPDCFADYLFFVGFGNLVIVECAECSRLPAEQARLNRAHTVAFDKVLGASLLLSTEFFLAKATQLTRERIAPA